MMPRRERIFILVLLGTVVLAVGVELLVPEPVDWTDSFERDDARPYGSEVIYAVLPALFPAAEVEAVELPPYLRLRDTTGSGGAYAFVTHRFDPDTFEAKRLLSYAARGNTLFVAAHQFEGPFADTLRIRTSVQGIPYPDISGLQADTTALNFTHPALRRSGGYPMRGGTAAFVFTRLDSSRATVLGRRAAADTHAVTFARVPLGEGAVYLSSTPRAFTNYHVLQDSSAAYVYAALSHLSPETTTLWWDAYHKPLARRAQTPLRFVLAEPALRRAYYVLLVGIVLFVIFQGRRRQRAIPVIEPPANDTLEFVETVGRLYYRRGDHADLAQKKIAYFLDYVRSRLRLPTDTLDDAWCRRVAQRAGVAAADVEVARDAIASVRDRETLTETELKHLARRVDAVYADRVR